MTADNLRRSKFRIELKERYFFDTVSSAAGDTREPFLNSEPSVWFPIIPSLLPRADVFYFAFSPSVKRHFWSLEFALVFNLDVVTNRMQLIFASVGNIYRIKGETSIGIT